MENEEFYAETQKQSLAVIADDNVNNNDNENDPFYDKLEKSLLAAAPSLITSH